MAANTVTFPAALSASNSMLSLNSYAENRQSVVSVSHATALEICDLVYGASVPSWEAIERFYEPSATYENPIVTATSRAVIADIHTMASHLAQIDVPRPVAVLHALLGMKMEYAWRQPWFRALQVWSEVEDVCESESFDGHRKTIVEHTLHILLLPNLHNSATQEQTIPTSYTTNTPANTDRSMSFSSSALQHIAQTSTLGLDLSIPSPFHLRLPIISRLSFNDAGRITHHRDFWDAKDLLGLVPGMSIAQWISGRLLAQGIRGMTWIGRSLFWSEHEQKVSQIECSKQRLRDEESGRSPVGAHSKSIR